MRRFVASAASHARLLAMRVRLVLMVIGLSVTDSAARDQVKGRDRAQAGEGNARVVRHNRATGRGAQVQALAHGNICRSVRGAVMTDRHSRTAAKRNVQVIASLAVVSAAEPVKNERDGLNRPFTCIGVSQVLRRLTRRFERETVTLLAC